MIKNHHTKDHSLIYTDIGSFLLKCNGIDILDEDVKRPLVNFMDLSKFDTNHPSYNVAYKVKLGLLNSETGSIPMKEYLFTT